MKKIGPVLDNDLQTLPSPLPKRADGKIFLVYVSDDFKTTKKIKEKKN